MEPTETEKELTEHRGGITTITHLVQKKEDEKEEITLLDK